MDIAKAGGASAANVQLERGESGTLHIQAFVAFPNPKMLAAVNRIFKECHIESAKNALNAWKYCGKSDTEWRAQSLLDQSPKARSIPRETLRHLTKFALPSDQSKWSKMERSPLKTISRSNTPPISSNSRLLHALPTLN